MKLFRSVYVTLVNLAHVERIIRRAQIHHQIYRPPVSLSDNDFSNQVIEAWENHTCYQKKKCNRMADMLIFRKLLLLDRKRFILYEDLRLQVGYYGIFQHNFRNEKKFVSRFSHFHGYFWVLNFLVIWTGFLTPTLDFLQVKTSKGHIEIKFGNRKKWKIRIQSSCSRFHLQKNERNRGHKRNRICYRDPRKSSTYVRNRLKYFWLVEVDLWLVNTFFPSFWLDESVIQLRQHQFESETFWNWRTIIRWWN